MSDVEPDEESKSDLIWEDDSDNGNSFIMSGSHTIADYKAAMRLSSSSFQRNIVGSICVLTLLTSAVVAVAIVTRPHPIEDSDYLLLMICLGVMGLIVGPRLIGGFRLRQMARKQQGIFSPTHSVFDSFKITTNIEGSKIEHEWTAFSRVLTDDKVALLVFKNSSPPVLLARRKLQAPATWDEFVNFLCSKVPE